MVAFSTVNGCVIVGAGVSGDDCGVGGGIVGGLDGEANNKNGSYSGGGLGGGHRASSRVGVAKRGCGGGTSTDVGDIVVTVRLWMYDGDHATARTCTDDGCLGGSRGGGTHICGESCSGDSGEDGGEEGVGGSAGIWSVYDEDGGTCVCDGGSIDISDDDDGKDGSSGDSGGFAGGRDDDDGVVLRLWCLGLT